MQPITHLVGLSADEVVQSRKQFGTNVLTPPKKESLWLKFVEKFTTPLIVILLIAGILSVGISFYEYFGMQSGAEVFFEPVGIFIAIFLATGLSFYFEVKADKEFAILNQVNDDEPVQVVRDGKSMSIPKRDVVTGDIVILSTGDEIPADGELLEAVNLCVDESSLTGEPICQKSTACEDFDPHATFPTNYALRGTKVMEGHGIMRVATVGDHTENGKVFVAAQIDDSVKTPLNEQLEKLARVISNFSYAVAGLIILGRLVGFFHWAPVAWLLVIPTGLFFYLVICHFPRWRQLWCVITIVFFFALFIAMVLGMNEIVYAGTIEQLVSYTLQTLMIAVTLIVVSVPEGLPMAVTLSLAYSMRRMLKTNNLVRKMHACETMGATTVICTDKTGTLTQNRMTVHETAFYGLPASQALGTDNMSRLIEEGIAVNSTASLEFDADGSPSVLGNPTEGALLLWLHAQGINYLSLKEAAQREAEVPFNTERKYMATVVRSAAFPGKRILYVKGAPEIVYSLCASCCEASMDQEKISAQLLVYQQKAMRTLGFAYQILEGDEKSVEEGNVTARRLSFLGIVAIADPVRSEVPAAIRQCLEAGIDIKIVTGDTPGTAREIGRQIGLWKEGDTDDQLITGPEFAALTDEELWAKILDIKIISRARPLDKKRLVETLQKKGQVVAVTGDGTNDAPALKAAHVGLSMGDGTGVAKEASDITIIDNSFSSIARAVMWGRSLYQNIQRFILFQMTVNVVACLIVLFGAFFGTKSPLTVTQMLWVNLIMDTFAATALASLPPSSEVMNDKPRPRTAFIINSVMQRAIAGWGIFLTFLLMGFLIYMEHFDVPSLLSVGQCLPNLIGEPSLSGYELSLFFTLFVMLQFWNLFNARAFATKCSAFHFKGCGAFLLIAAIILFGQILIVSFGGEMFGVEPLSLVDWILAILLSSSVLWIGEISRLVKLKR